MIVATRMQFAVAAATSPSIGDCVVFGRLFGYDRVSFCPIAFHLCLLKFILEFMS